MIKQIDFSEIEGIQIGHAQNFDAATGCSVVICEAGASVGVDVRGGAPGTRETDLLNPVNLIQKVHAVILAGGSAFGLDAAAGVMRYLEERAIGFDVQVTRVPIVCGAVLFDLTIGDWRIRPDKDMGYQACVNAGSDVCIQGSIGAGTGATVGKILGMERAMKSGMGCHALQSGDLKVGALVAVNCLGDILDPLTGKKLAGPLNEDMQTLADTEEIMIQTCSEKKNLFSGNTTIGIVATNAALPRRRPPSWLPWLKTVTPEPCEPAHSMFDGDAIFAMSTGVVEADLSVVGLLAARVMERAVISAVTNAGSLCGIKSYTDLNPGAPMG